MKKLSLVTITTLFGLFTVFAQNKKIDLQKGVLNNIKLEGSTLSTESGNGELAFPAEDYSKYQGLKLSFSNFKKLDEATSNPAPAIHIFYIDAEGKDQKVSMSFYVQGQKNIDFASVKKSSTENIAIKPESIKKISVGLGSKKQIDMSVELVEKK